MCEVSKDYKLCTCSTKVDKTKPYWILNKGIQKPDDPERISILGTMVGPDEDNSLRYVNEDRLLEDLNSKNIFDFDYQPVSFDILKIYDGKFIYQFIYDRDEFENKWTWRPFDSGPFSDDRKLFKMRWKKKGFIDGDI